MRIAVLGPLEVDEGRTLLAPRDQVVLEALAVRAGETVRAESLAEALWGEDLPPSWPKVVQGCVSRLRKVLGSSAIVTSGAGYRLVLHRDDFDHLCFEDLLLRAGELLAAGEPERARYASGQALGLWRGDPLDRLTEWEHGRIESERLGERRRDAEDLYAESAIRAGRHGDVVGELHRMVAQQPTRERRWGLLALAQYQAGRQAEALGTLQRARSTLVNEFGLDPGPQLAELENAILRQDPALVIDGAAPASAAACPYLGLVAYGVGDAAAYFGREADVAACLQRLDEVGVLAVVGPSGSGKSSLIRAGVAAALLRDGHPVQIVTPGAHPEDALSQAPAGAGAVFVVDQCEEALALDETSAEREGFFAGLVDFAPRGRLVLSLRADRLGELAAHPEFAHLVEKGLYLLGGMGQAELRSAIQGPVAQAGLRLEPGLVDLLVREVEGSPGALPLLSHVLRQTWRRREGDTLTVQGYAATGGVREAVAQSAERLYRDLTPTQQGMLRDLMVRLVSCDDAGEPVRTRVARRTVTSDDEHTAVVEALVGARLLSSDGDTVEIAHESLAVAWPRLRSWLDDDVDGLRIMRHLSVAAGSWDGLGRPDSELYRGVRQARAAEWRKGHDPQLTPQERAFLDASAELAETEERATEVQVRRERRSNQRLRAGLAAVALLLAVSIVAGALAKTAADRADQQSLVADARRLGAEALRSPDLDRSLLLATAGVRLNNTVETRNSLLAALNRAPALLRTGRTHPSLISMAVNPITGVLAVQSAGIDLRFYDGDTLDEVPGRASGEGVGLSASPDGTLLARSLPTDKSAAADGPRVELLDQTGRLAITQLGRLHDQYVSHEMAFSPNSRWLVVTSDHIRGESPPLTSVWDLRSPDAPVTLLNLNERGHSPAITSDGLTVFSTGQGSLVATDVRSGEQRVFGPADLGVRSIDHRVVLGPGGRLLAVGAGGDTVLLDPATMRRRFVLGGSGDSTDDISFSPSGDRVAASGDHLAAWDLSGEEPRQLFRQEGRGKVAFSPDGRTLHSAQVDGLLLSWDLTGEYQFLRKLAGPPLASAATVARISPNGALVAYVGGSPPSLQVRDVATGRLSPPVALGLRELRAPHIAWHHDNTTLTVTTGDSAVRTWNATTGLLLAEENLGTPGSGEGATVAEFSSDGRQLLLGSTRGRLHFLDARTLQPARASIPVTRASGSQDRPSPLERFTVSPDGRTVLTPTATVDVIAGKVGPTPDLGFPGAAFTYSPIGSHLLVDAGEEGVGLVRASTMAWLARPNRSHPSGGTFAAFTASGAQVANVAQGRIGRWSVNDGQFIGEVTVSEEATVAFSADETSLVIATLGGSLLTWDLRPWTWEQAACQEAGRTLTQAEWSDYLPDRSRVPVCSG